MKKQKITFFIFVYFLFQCFCIQTDNYIDYFHKINKAELLITKSEYEKSLNIYKTTLRNYPHSFYKDIHNACVCAIKLDKPNDAFEYAKMLILYGYELEDFDKEPFEYLKNNKKLWEKFMSDYPKIRNEYLTTINTELRQKYYSLFINDQLAAAPRTDKNIKEQDSCFYQLSIDIAELIEKNGFPNWMINKDTMSMKLMGMLRHYCGLENRINENIEMQNDILYITMSRNKIHEIVNSAFSNGLILPDTYVAITTYWMNKNPYGGKILMNVDIENEKITPVFHFSLTPEDIVQINKNRENIGLAPVNHENRDLFNTTLYKNYPFKEIKEALKECVNCSQTDSVKIIADISFKKRDDKNNNEKSHFILLSIDGS